MKNLHILQQESIDEGRLQVRVRQKNMGTPVADARVSVSYSGDPQGKIEETDTNESGSIEAVEIATPPLEYSMSPRVISYNTSVSDYPRRHLIYSKLRSDCRKISLLRTNIPLCHNLPFPVSAHTPVLCSLPVPYPLKLKFPSQHPDFSFHRPPR